MLKLDINIIFNIVNVLVLYLLMKRFLFSPITEIMEKRTNSIKASFEEAENKNNEAMNLKREYEKALESAELKAEIIINEAKQRAQQEHEKQMKATKDEISQMMETAKKSIELERIKSMHDAQSEIAGIAMIVATKLIQKNLDENSNKKLVNDFLSEVGALK